MQTYTIFPGGMLGTTIAQFVSEPFDTGHAAVYDHTRIAQGQLPDLTYADALAELRRWREANIWDLAPMAVEDGIGTDAAIDSFRRLLADDATFRDRVLSAIRATFKTTHERAASILDHGISPEMARTFDEIESECRLDKVL